MNTFQSVETLVCENCKNDYQNFIKERDEEFVKNKQRDIWLFCLFKIKRERCRFLILRIFLEMSFFKTENTFGEGNVEGKPFLLFQ